MNNYLQDPFDTIIKACTDLYPKLLELEIDIFWDNTLDETTNGLCRRYEDNSFQITLNLFNESTSASFLTLIHEITHIIQWTEGREMCHDKHRKQLQKRIIRHLKKRIDVFT